MIGEEQSVVDLLVLHGRLVVAIVVAERAGDDLDVLEELTRRRDAAYAALQQLRQLDQK